MSVGLKTMVSNPDIDTNFKKLDNFKVDVADGVPVGAITMFAGAVAPDRNLLCNGAAVSRITYKRLFAVTGTTYGVGDGTTTFNLPDMIGASPTGVGTSAGYTENETIALGTKYNDQLQGHKAYSVETNPRLAFDGASGGAIYRTVAPNAAGFDLRTEKTSTPIDDGTNGTPRTGLVTRGKRVGLNFIIKF